MAVAVNNNTSTISPVDALWTLIMSQSKSVRKALAERMEQLNNQEKASRAKASDTTLNAIREVRAGKAHKCSSFDDFKNRMNEI